MTHTIRLSTALFVLAMATGARAQEAPPLTPPVAQSSTDVPYPDGAVGDAVVDLELVVEADGTVSTVDVLEGDEPFAAEARRAALSWTFAPARRGETPVAAKIRARVELRQPPPAPSAPPPAASIPPPPPTVQETPLEVTVRGARREIGQTTLSAADVREMPGAFGDPFRAVEALPGVAPVLSGLPYFYVRGAPPNNNGYLVDGIRVPFLFHVGIGEGVIHPALIEDVDFYAGAPPAAYGGYAGAIIAGQTREPTRQLRGQANIRLLDAGGLVETPVGGDRGTLLVAGRYGYPGPILGLLDSSQKLGYWDYQTRATWRVGDGGTLALFAFGSHDYWGNVTHTHDPDRPYQVTSAIISDFHRLDLRYDQALAGGHFRVASTLGYDSQGGSAGSSDDAPPAMITDRSAAVRLEFDKRLSDGARMRGGLEGRIDKYTFEQGTLLPNEAGAVPPPVPATIDPPPTNLTGAAHLDVVWRIGSRLEIVPGLRVGIFDSKRPSAPAGDQARTTVPAVDPRLSMRLTITPRLASITAVGVSHQYPALRAGPLPGMVLSAPGFPFGDTHLQRAVQASQGVEVALPAEVTLTANGFLSLWSGLTDLTSLCLQVMPPTTPPRDPNAPPPTIPYICPDDQPVNGRAYGLELLVRRPLSKRLAGWLSYTLSRSTRDAHFATLSGDIAAARVTSEFDRTHVLNAILAYDLGRRWRAGGRFVYLSGAPYSDLAGNVPVPPYNNHRAPSFFRLDVRVEKRWSLGKDRSIAFVLEGLNVTLSRELSPLGLDCIGNMTPDGGTTQCTHGRLGPLTIPSVGVEAFF